MLCFVMSLFAMKFGVFHSGMFLAVLMEVLVELIFTINYKDVS